MTNEEIIRQEARDAIGYMDTNTFMEGAERFIDKIRPHIIRFRKPIDKAIFLNEIQGMAQAVLEAHRAVCRKGPDCPADKNIQSSLYFLQQDIDELPSLDSKEEGLSSNQSSKYDSTKAEPMRKVFISHASADRKIVDELVELLELIGVPPGSIFYTSVPEYGITPGENFLARIKAEISEHVLVLFAMSQGFFDSPVCLCEMGAAWVLSKSHIPVMIPPFSFKDMKGVLPQTQGVTLTDAEQINMLAKTIATMFDLPLPSQNPGWERKRNRIISRVSEIIATTPYNEGVVQPNVKADSTPIPYRKVR